MKKLVILAFGLVIIGVFHANPVSAGCDPEIYDPQAMFVSNSKECPSNSCLSTYTDCGTYPPAVCAICWPERDRTGKGCGDFCINNAECGSKCPICRKLPSDPYSQKVCQTKPTPPPVVKRDPCYDYKNKTVIQECAACLGGETDKEDLNRPHYGEKYWTALGCIPVKPGDFIKTLIRIGFGIGGGIAFLFMVMGVIKILTSQGNPETLNDGRGMITSAIAGLLLVIFSVIVLKIIGVDILELPGFKK